MNSFPLLEFLPGRSHIPPGRPPTCPLSPRRILKNVGKVLYCLRICEKNLGRWNLACLMVASCSSFVFREPPERPRELQKEPQGSSKTHPRAPEESLRAAKEAPREPNGPKRTPKTRPRAPKHAPRAPIEARKPLGSQLYILYTLHFSCLLSTLDLRLSTLYSLLSTLNSRLSTLYSLLSRLFSLLSTPYSLLPTSYSPLPTP